MRILSVATFSHPEYFGGAERVITTVAEGLAARGHEVTLLTGHADGTADEEVRHGVRVVRYPITRGSPTTFYRSVWKGVRRALRAGVGGDAQLVHLHQMLSAVAAISPGSGLAVPRLFSFYAPYHQEYLARYREGLAGAAVPLKSRAIASILKRADRYLLDHSDGVLVLSRFSRAQIEDSGSPAMDRVQIAGAGVDLERFRPPVDDDDRGRCRRRLGLEDDGAPWLLSVRRLVPRMGLGDLLDACAGLARRGLAFRLALAGDGEQRAALQERASELDLGDRVRFLGRVADDELGDLYRACSLFVLPTRSLEGFGMVTAEALAAGLPVVGTDAGATTEVLGGVPGSRLVPAGDPAALETALAESLQDPVALETAGRAAREHAEQSLHWDVHLDALEAMARRLVEGAS